MKNLIKTFLITPIFLLCFFAFPQDAAGLTFGKTSIGGTDLSFPLNDAKTACMFALSEAGDVTKLTAYVKQTAGITRDARGIIYDESSNLPVNLEGSTNTSSVTGSFQWLDFTFASSLSLVTANYFLGLHASNSAITGKGDSAGTNRYQSALSDEFDDGSSDPFGASSASSYQRSIYATYTAGGAERRMFLIE